MTDQLIRPLYKLQRGWIADDHSLLPDDECIWLDEVECQWLRDNPKLTDYQARKMFGLLPPPDAVRGGLDRDQVLAKVDMVRLIEQYCQPPYRRYGDRMTVRCPFHGEDKRPSMSVWIEAKRWRCWVEQEGGTAIDLVMRSEGLGFLQALQRLNQMI